MFSNIVITYSDNLRALRDFVDMISPLLKEKREKLFLDEAHSFATVILALSKLSPDEYQLDDRAQDYFQTLSKADIELKEDEVTGEKSANIKGLPDQAAFASALRLLVTRHYQDKILYQSSLMSLVSMAEWFLSQILHIYFERYPNAVGGKDKVFSLEDLRSIGTIEDARSYIVDARVEDILRGSFEDWITFFKETAKLSMGYIQSDHDVLVEIFQRRNLIVHNGGIINGIYLSKITSQLSKGLTRGNEIEVSHDYLTTSIDLFERAFTLITAELWKKLDPNDKARGDALLSMIDEHLTNSRWEIAKGLGFFLTNDKMLPEKVRLRGQIHYWQALKSQGKLEEIRSDIENADLSAKEKIFQLDQLALLGREDEFFVLLSDLVSKNLISPETIAGSPIYADMRMSVKYLEFSVDDSDNKDSGLDKNNKPASGNVTIKNSHES